MNAVVGLGLGKDYAATTAKAIANAGGLARVVKAGNTVLIKPNLCWSNITSRPVNTDYRVVAEIVRQVVQEAFDYLDAPPRVLGGRNTPIPFSPVLEDVCVPGKEEIIEAIKELVK